MFNTILIVCAGNICRSPTAEYLLKDKLANSEIKVSSTGLTAMVDKGADVSAVKIALSHHIDLSSHKGRQITKSLITENELILVMEQRHLSDLLRQYPHARGKVFLLGKWINDIEISDPYRQSYEAFEHVYKLIDKACRAWIRYL